jgi:competence protein ComEC
VGVPLWAVLSLSVGALPLLYKKNVITLVLVIAVGVGWGAWRGAAFLPKVAQYQVLQGKTVVLEGRAATDGVYGKNAQLTFDVRDLQVVSPRPGPIVGQIEAAGFGEKAVYRGDKVQVTGKLFLARGSRQGRVRFAKLRVVQRSSSVIEKLRLRFGAGMLSSLPEPHASFGLGLLVGQRSTLPKITADQLAAVGLTHIIAVSGYNLTIIIRAVRRLLGKRSKYQTVLWAFALMGSFLLFTGFSASIVRAALVSTLALLAWYYGRAVKPMVLLTLTAALTAGWYPLYLWSDIGWYLSFLAFFGVLVVAPALLKRLYRRKQPSVLAQLLVETMTAQIMTLPLIMYIFGEVSLIALPANMLVAPIVPLAMLFALVAGVAGMIAAPIVGWLAWPARLVLTYMLDIVANLSRVPHALSKQSLAAWQMIALYSLGAAISLVLVHTTRPKRGIITDEEIA